MPSRSESADCWFVYKAGHEASMTHQITRNTFLTRLLRCFEGLRDSCVQSVSSPVSQAACVFQPPRRCLASKSTHNQRNSTSTRRYVLWGVSNYVRPLERVHFSVLLRNHAFSSYVTCLFRLVRIALATRYDAPRVFFLFFFVTPGYSQTMVSGCHYTERTCGYRQVRFPLEVYCETSSCFQTTDPALAPCARWQSTFLFRCVLDCCDVAYGLLLCLVRITVRSLTRTAIGLWSAWGMREVS